MSIGTSFKNIDIKAYAFSFLDWLGRGVEGVVPSYAKVTSSNSEVEENTLSKVSVYVRKVEFPTASLSSARSSCELMIDRLSPLLPQNIVWDIAGPLEQDVLQSTDVRKSYELAIAKREAVEAAYKRSKNPVVYQHGSGSAFRFFLDEEYRAGGVKFAFSLFFAVFLAFLSFWTLSQWETYYGKRIVSYNFESQKLAHDIESLKIRSEQYEAEAIIAANYVAKKRTFDSLTFYNSIVESIPVSDSLSVMTLTQDEVEFSGSTLDMTVLQGALEKIPNSEVSVRRTGAANFSGQERFKGNVSRLNKTKRHQP